MGTSIGNEVYVLDNDYLKVYIYNLLTKQSQAYQIEYVATDNLYSKSRKNSSNVLPHNF